FAVHSCVSDVQKAHLAIQPTVRAPMSRSPSPAVAVDEFVIAAEVAVPTPAMPKRKSKVTSPKALGVFAASALVAFLAGEALLLSRSDPGQLSLAKSVGQRERVVR